jgi:hypothetical protein
MNQDQEVTAHFSDEPTIVVVAGPAAVDLQSHIMVSWETAIEINICGFNLKRGESQTGPFVQVNTSMIPAQRPGGVIGATYTYTDTTAESCPRWYILEIVRTGGAEETEPTQAIPPATMAFLPLTLR